MYCREFTENDESELHVICYIFILLQSSETIAAQDEGTVIQVTLEGDGGMSLSNITLNILDILEGDEASITVELIGCIPCK